MRPRTRFRAAGRPLAAFRFAAAGLGLFCTATALPHAAAQTAGDRQAVSPGEEIPAENCMVKYIRHVNIPAEVEGKLVALKIEEGMSVKRGDVLAVIDDTNAQLTLNLKLAEEKEASLNASSDVNLRDAKNAEKLAIAEAESYRELYRKGAVPMYEMRKKELEAVRAGLRIELAENDLDIKEAQYIAKRNEREIAEYEVARRQIVAPFDGYVEMRIAQLGEWVQPGSPIATIVELDRLRVEGDVNALLYGRQVTPGMPVRVRVHVGADEEQTIEVAGKIGFVSSEIDLNDHYRVWVDIDNRQVDGGWAIKPGMRADIFIQPGRDLASR